MNQPPPSIATPAVQNLPLKTEEESNEISLADIDAALRAAEVTPPVPPENLLAALGDDVIIPTLDTAYDDIAVVDVEEPEIQEIEGIYYLFFQKS